MKLTTKDIITQSSTTDTQRIKQQYAKFSATSTGETGGNLSYDSPTNIPWILSKGRVNELSLATGQYHIIINSTSIGLNNGGGPGGSYYDLGLSQNGSNVSTSRYNLNGFGGFYFINPNASSIFNGSEGTVTAYGVSGGGAKLSSTNQQYTVKIIKCG